MYDLASFSEENIHETWSFANFGNTLLSKQRINEKIKCSINVFSSLKAQPKKRRQSMNYLRISKSKALNCSIFAHANYYPLTIPSMKKISPAPINGERCLQGLIQESSNSYTCRSTTFIATNGHCRCGCGY